MLRRADPTVTTPRVTVAVLDQTPLFREGLCGRVSREPGMRLAGVGGRPLSLAHDRLPVDVLVMDAVLDPRGHLLHRLMSANQGLAVVVLVREPYRTSRFVAQMLAVGVHGLVWHAAPPERIMDAIRLVRANGRYLDPALAPLVPAARGSMPARPRELSNREFQVLQLIADGLSNQAIAQSLTLSVETVRTHIKGLLRKLEARDRAHAVALGFRLGVLGDRVPTGDGGGAPH